MTKENFFLHLRKKLDTLKEEGLFKEERIIISPQGSRIKLKDGREVLNFCANNYLGLASDQTVVNDGKKALDEYGFGMSSVRFICGTLDIHKKLEDALSSFLKTEDTILYSSCFDANGGLFEALLSEEDAIISDSLNHASIIDGVRLCKAARFRYRNNDMQDLEERLKEASSCRFKLIATDGVFSMDGIIANLKGVSALAKKYGALLMVDDSHAVGFLGANGRGTHEYTGCIEDVDILTGTLGKALGGASGGYVSGRKEIIALLRQVSRPYLFSNTLMPAIVKSSIEIIKRLSSSKELMKKVMDNAAYFRKAMGAAGFEIIPGIHPIVPVMLKDAHLAKDMAFKLLEEGVYVIGFCYPVVPKGLARIRVQLSAAHKREDLDFAINAFIKVGKKLGVIK